jgi:hypothetical protein
MKLENKQLNIEVQTQDARKSHPYKLQNIKGPKSVPVHQNAVPNR